MEGTMAEIRMFAANFAPKYWAFCSGQILAIATNQAMFSLLGTIYGGNGTTNFGLPDFRGKIPVGTGNSSSGNVVLGQIIGTETVTIVLNNMPAHVHSYAIGGNVGLKAKDAIGNQSTAGASNYLAIPARSAGRSQTKVKSFSKTTGTITLHPDTVQVKVDTQSTGGSQPHNNMQPSLGMNYIICLQGIYPSRN